MATRANPKRLTFDEFLVWEHSQEQRHEFADGDVLAMSGGTLRHGRVQRNLLQQIADKLRSGPCEAMGNDVALFVTAANRSFYPDAYIVCDQSAFEERGVATDATVIFEILSPSMAAYDRTDKFAFYRLLPGFRHYVTIDPEALTFEGFRLADGIWGLVESEGAGQLALPDIGLVLDTVDLFRGVGEPRETVGARRAASA